MKTKQVARDFRYIRVRLFALPFHVDSTRGVGGSREAPSHGLPEGHFAVATPYGVLDVDIDGTAVVAKFPSMNEALYPSTRTSDVRFQRDGGGYAASYRSSSAFGAWEWYNKTSYLQRDFKLNLSAGQDGALDVKLQTTSTRFGKKGPAFVPESPTTSEMTAVVRAFVSDEV